VSPTVTPAELGLFLDTVANAAVPLRSVPQMADILARLIGLANSKTNIGALPAPEQEVVLTKDELAALEGVGG